MKLFHLIKTSFSMHFNSSFIICFICFLLLGKSLNCQSNSLTDNTSVLDVYCSYKNEILFNTLNVNELDKRRVDIVFYCSADSTSYVSIVAAHKKKFRIRPIDFNNSNFAIILNMVIISVEYVNIEMKSLDSKLKREAIK